MILSSIACLERQGTVLALHQERVQIKLTAMQRKDVGLASSGIL